MYKPAKNFVQSGKILTSKMQSLSGRDATSIYFDGRCTTKASGQMVQMVRVSRFGSHMQGSQFEMATVPKHTSNTQQYFHYGELAWFHTVGRCGLCGRWTPLTFVSNPRKRVQPVHSPTGIMWVIDIIQGL